MGDIEDIMLPVLYVQSLLQVVTVGCVCVCYAGGTLDRKEKKIMYHADRTCIECVSWMFGCMSMF